MVLALRAVAGVEGMKQSMVQNRESVQSYLFPISMEKRLSQD